MYKGQEMWQIETHTHTHTGVLSTKAKYANQYACKDAYAICIYRDGVCLPSA